MKAILDSSFWIAYVLEKDAQHRQAVNCFNRLNPTFIIPFTVQEELTAVLQSRESKQVAIAAIKNSLLAVKTNKVIYLDNQDNQAILELWQQLPNQIDFVDASVIYFSQKLNLPILTVDQHFYALHHADYPLNLAN